MAYQDVENYFKEIHLEDRLIVLDESSATVALAAKALGCEEEHIAKTLAFLVGDQPIVVVVAGTAKISNKKYKQTFHKKAKMISSDQLVDLIGHPMGGVCPFGLKENVKVYLDESIKKYDVLYPAAGSPNSAVRVTLEELENYSNYDCYVDVCEEDE